MNKIKATLPLVLTIPVPSLAVLFGMIILPNTAIGQTLFLTGKIWVLLIPTIWIFLIDKEKIKMSFPKWEGLLVGLLSGILISISIFAIYKLFGHMLIDPVGIKEMAKNVGLADKSKYLFMSLYWITVNSLLEEYVWRYFVVKKANEVFSSKTAIIISATGFTLHHILATQIYFNLAVVSLINIGVFTGGIIWSYLFLKYKSIWPGYISHAIIDIAVFVIGYFLIFS